MTSRDWQDTARSYADISEIRSRPVNDPERLGMTLGDLDANAELHLLRHPPQRSRFEEFLKSNFERNDNIAVGRLDHKGRMTQVIKPVREVMEPEYQQFLKQRNAHGDNIYISINSFKPGIHRTKADIEEVRHIGMDLDHGGNEALDRILNSGVHPHHVVQTSPEKYQLWFQVRSFDVSSAEAASRGLVRTFGSDPAATDVTRVFRAPGFQNLKYEDKPLAYKLRDVQTPAVKEYTPREFSKYIEIGRDRFPARSIDQDAERRSPGAQHRITQSERDWANVRDGLRRGKDPNELVNELAGLRVQINASGQGGQYKPDPVGYARDTVERARVAMEQERSIRHSR